MANLDAPKRTLTYYSRLALWLAILIITAGLSAQSLQINLLTQSTVDTSFSNAMTEQIELAFKLRLQDTKDLQRAASQHPYTLDALRDGGHENDLWLADLQSFLPGSQQVLVFNKDTAKNINQSLGYTAQDLVSRTLKGAEMRLEAITSGGTQRFYWTTPIYDGKEIVGVLLVEYGAVWLAQLKQSISSNLGQTILTQRFNPQDKGVELFNIGTPGKDTSLAITLPVNDIWYLTYTPNDERPQLALMPLTTPWIGVLLATLIGLTLLIFLQSRELRQNQFKLITYVRGLTRQSAPELPEFSLRLFHDLAVSIASQVQPSQSGMGGDDGRTEKPDLAIEPLRQRVQRVQKPVGPRAGSDEMVVEETPHDEFESYEPDRH